MVDISVQAQPAQSRFTGTRPEMFSILTRGYLAMIPTIGLYRFWLVTWKRRFYWSHTEIGGEALEYTGTARQLLIGFLIALAFFLPVYGLFFYLSTQGPTAALVGYSALGVLLWFFTGYAIYRGRDFRFSRTLWRGIRFDQKGNAWAYALRRFLWSILVVVTAGLAYPFMAVSLWRYRWNNTFYGDRAFATSARWRTIAGPFYGVYFTVLLLVGAGAAVIVSGNQEVASVFPVLAALAAWLGYYLYRAREVSRLGSTLSCGAAQVTVRVKGRSLFGQFLLYALTSLLCLLIGGVIAGALMASVVVPLMSDGNAPTAAEIGGLMRTSLVTLVLAVLGYLAMLASLAAMAELYLGIGFWKAVANNSTVTGIESLDTVRATSEDRALAGEGLADALNVGGY